MRRTLVLMSVGLLVVFLSCQQSPKRKAELKTEIEEISYAIGLDIGNNLKSSGLEIDIATLMQGIQDTLQGQKVLLTQKECMDVRQKMQKKMQEEREAQIAEKFKENKELGEKFLAENKSQSGVITTESGLQYKVIKEGKGAKPKETDKVSVHYKGTLVDGTEFDSSYSRNKPTEFQLNHVIKGWTEGLQLMNVGSKYIFYVPYGLGYGTRQSGPKIKPFSTLIFEVELIGIVK